MEFLDKQERWRKKNRVMGYSDTYGRFDFESIFEYKTAPNNAYMHRFSMLGHKVYERRSPEHLDAAKGKVSSSVEKKEAGGLSVWHDKAEPSDWYRSDAVAVAQAPEVVLNDNMDVLNLYIVKKDYAKPSTFSAQPKPAAIASSFII